MKRYIALIVVIMLFLSLLTSCFSLFKKEQIGPSGMTLSEIQSTAYNLDKTKRGLQKWLNEGCHEEYGESLPPIPAHDELGQFNYRTVIKYQTMDELHNVFKEIYAAKLAEQKFEHWCTEQVGVKNIINGSDDGWLTVTYQIFKELDGRLYVADDTANDNDSSILPPYDMESLIVREESEDQITVAQINSYATEQQFIIVNENERWLIEEEWFVI